MNNQKEEKLSELEEFFRCNPKLSRFQQWIIPKMMTWFKTFHYISFKMGYDYYKCGGRIHDK